jgi:peptidoglycan/xylan/chitin deacetylase (PgdA/CDA1 family)
MNRGHATSLSDREALHWPDGRRAAVCFSFDIDVDTYPRSVDPGIDSRPGALSQGFYEPGVGVPLLLETLRRREVTATFFVPGQVAEQFPRCVEEIVAAGHELGIHGYTHASPSQLGAAEEEAELVRAMDILSGFGTAVVGYRAPSFEISPRTVSLLEKHQLAYSSNLMDSVWPYRHPGGAIAEIPVEWVLCDSAYWQADYAGAPGGVAAPATVEAIWSGEMQAIAALGGACVFTMHPTMTARPARLTFLERMIDLARSDGGLYVATCAEIAACVTRS